MYELFCPLDEEISNNLQDYSELSDRSDYEVDQMSRLPNIIHTRTSPTTADSQLPAPCPSAFSTPSPLRSESSFTVKEETSALLKTATALGGISTKDLISQAVTITDPTTQYGQYLTATYANTLSSSPSSLFARPSTLPFIRSVDTRNNMSRPGTEATKTVLTAVPKLPLQFTKSMEEMLKPPGQTEEAWNRPLGNDWANGMTTPNKEIVAHFFPECADAI